MDAADTRIVRFRGGQSGGGDAVDVSQEIRANMRGSGHFTERVGVVDLRTSGALATGVPDSDGRGSHSNRRCSGLKRVSSIDNDDSNYFTDDPCPRRSIA